MRLSDNNKILLWTRKIIVLALGIFIMSFGGVLCVKSGIGLAPATIVPYTLSCVYTLSFGTFTTLFNILLILVQIVCLRRDFKIWQLLQFVVAFLFGITVDLSVEILQNFTADDYAIRWLCTISGTALIAVGISFEILSESIPAPADSTIRTISRVTNSEFGNVKIIFDCIMVTLALLISWIGLGKIVGIREGSVFLVLVTGLLVKKFVVLFSSIKKFTT